MCKSSLQTRSAQNRQQHKNCLSCQTFDMKTMKTSRVKVVGHRRSQKQRVALRSSGLGTPVQHLQSAVCGFIREETTGSPKTTRAANFRISSRTECRFLNRMDSDAESTNLSAMCKVWWKEDLFFRAWSQTVSSSESFSFITAACQQFSSCSNVTEQQSTKPNPSRRRLVSLKS